MKTKLGKLSTGWRIVVALALVFAMVPALAVATAGTAGAQGPQDPILDGFKAYCICPGCPDDELRLVSDPQGGLYGCVEFVIDANSQGDDDLCYLEIDLYGCGDNCEDSDPQLMQFDVAADESNIFQHAMGNCDVTWEAWSQWELDVAAEMGILVADSYYDQSGVVDDDQQPAEAWHIFIDLTKLWSPKGVELGVIELDDIGTPVFPKCCEDGVGPAPHLEGYSVALEVGDTDGGDTAGDNDAPCDVDPDVNKIGGDGDLTSSTWDLDFYGMHMIWPNEYDPICTTEGCMVDINWNFHADCEPSEGFEILIYLDNDLDGLPDGTEITWGATPGNHWIADL